MKIFVGLAAICLASISITSTAEARRGGFVSALIRGGAHAATHSNSGSTSNTGSAIQPIKAYGPDVLTTTQLESCLRKASDLDRNGGLLDMLSDRVTAEAAAIDRAQADLRSQESSVDRYSAASVNAFNARLDAIRTRIDSHNVNVRQVKSDEAAHNSAVNLYNADCAKKYYRDDMEAAKARLGITSGALQ